MAEHEIAQVAQDGNNILKQATQIGGTALSAWLGKHLFDSFRGSDKLKSLKEGQQSNTERIIRIEETLKSVATREDVLKAVGELGKELGNKLDSLREKNA